MKLWKKIALWAGTGLALLTADSSLYVVDQSQQAVVTRFGNPKKVILNPIDKEKEKQRIQKMREEYEGEGMKISEGAGLYVKLPFIESARKFERRLLDWDGYPEEVPTKDKKYLHVDSSVRFYIDDPLKFLRNVETEEQAHARLDDIVDAATRNAITRRDLIEIVRTSNREMQVTEEELKETVRVDKVSEGREKIAQEINDRAREICEQYGIGIHEKGYLIKGLVYVDSVKEKVEDRMISERQRIAEKYRSEGEGEYQKIMGNKERERKRIISEAYRKSKEIEGSAEAEAVTIYANAYNRDPNFYSFLRSLEVYKNSFTSGTQVLLGTDNPLLQYLKGTNLPSEKSSEKK